MSEPLSHLSQSDSYVLIPWEDNYGDHNWAIVCDGKVVGKYGSLLSAEAALERLRMAQ